MVDDEKALVDAARQMLERLGYDVVARTSSVEALEKFRNAPYEFDIIITDRTMPNMTGFELAKKVIKIRPETPVILCTGFSEKQDIEELKVKGISALVMKPINRQEIAETIRKVLDQEKCLMAS